MPPEHRNSHCLRRLRGRLCRCLQGPWPQAFSDQKLQRRNKRTVVVHIVVTRAPGRPPPDDEWPVNDNLPREVHMIGDDYGAHGQVRRGGG